MIERITNPEKIGYAVGWFGLDDLGEKGLSIVKTTDLETLENLCVLGWYYTEIEGQVGVPEAIDRIEILRDLFGDHADFIDVRARLTKLFQKAGEE